MIRRIKKILSDHNSSTGGGSAAAGGSTHLGRYAAPVVVVHAMSAMRNSCVTAYNRALEEVDIDTLRRVMNLLRTRASFGVGSLPHQMAANVAFFGSAEALGERAAFGRMLRRVASGDTWKLRELVAGSTFAAWECVRDLKEGDGQGATWKLVGPEEALSGEEAAALSERVVAVTDIQGHPIASRVGEVRVGWMVALGQIRTRELKALTESLVGQRALLFSMTLEARAVERLQKGVARRCWHGEDPQRGESVFYGADYLRDLLTQALDPTCEEYGLDENYFLPMPLRSGFPRYFRSELCRQLGQQRRDGGYNWHVDLARASDEKALENFLRRVDHMRERLERRINHYRNEEVDLRGLRRLYDDTAVLGSMGAGARGEIELGQFPPLEMQRVEYLDLDEKWLSAGGLDPTTTIERARVQMQAAGKQRRTEFEQSVARHVVRLRWVSLMGAHRARLGATGDAAPTEAQRALGLPGYDELIYVYRQLFFPLLADRPLREVLSALKTRLSRLEKGLNEMRRAGGESEPAEWTLEHLPTSATQFASIRGIGEASLLQIRDGLMEELLAWPRGVGEQSVDRKLAEERLSDGLDELGDLFD